MDLNLSLSAIFYLLLANTVTLTKSQTTLGRLQVSEHFVTQRSSSGQVSVPESCSTVGSYSRCNGELNGRYTWPQENTQTNFVLFILSQRASISSINLTYIVASATQEPKVSFCIVSADTFINSSFTGLTCDEISIQALSSGDEQSSTLNVPMNNGTSRVTMEIITDGIKVQFVAMRVEFYGTSETAIAGTDTPPTITTSTTVEPVRGNSTRSESTAEVTGGAMPDVMYTTKAHTVLSLVSVALSTLTILTLIVIF